MNIYGRVSVLMARFAGLSYAPTAAPVPRYLRELERVSREFDAETGRQFYGRVATQYHAWTGNAAVHDRRWLVLYQDLAAVSAVDVDDDGDGVYELSLVEGTDYIAGPENRLPDRPISALYLLPTGTQLTWWPTARRSVRITGTWGYSAETEATGTLLNGAINSSQTSITVDDGSAVDVGETIVIDAEQCAVEDIATNTLVVVRGINGTTAASHADNAVVSRRRYPRDIEEAVVDRAAALIWRAQDVIEGPAEPHLSMRPGYAAWRRTVERYRVLPVAGVA
jgi:hypothetical protein